MSIRKSYFKNRVRTHQVPGIKHRLQQYPATFFSSAYSIYTICYLQVTYCVDCIDILHYRRGHVLFCSAQTLQHEVLVYLLRSVPLTTLLFIYINISITENIIIFQSQEKREVGRRQRGTFMPQIPFSPTEMFSRFQAIYIFLDLWKQSREKGHIMLNILSIISNGFIFVGSLVKILRIKGSYQWERWGLGQVGGLF
jgi:hypothetical protein